MLLRETVNDISSSYRAFYVRWEIYSCFACLLLDHPARDPVPGIAAWVGLFVVSFRMYDDRRPTH